MSTKQVHRAEAEAAVALQAHEAEERKLDARGRKARGQILEANLFAAQEARLTEEHEAEEEIRLRYLAHQDAMDDVVTTLTAYTEARERLVEAEELLKRSEGRARRAGVEVPRFDGLAFRATRDNDLAALGHRARRATSSGFFGAR